MRWHPQFVTANKAQKTISTPLGWEIPIKWLLPKILELHLRGAENVRFSIGDTKTDEIVKMEPTWGLYVNAYPENADEPMWAEDFPPISIWPPG
jgi:hypothetical protein